MDSTGGTTRLSFLERLRNPGDTRSWRRFHRHYGELLFNYARRLGAPHDVAEDIVQEVEMYVFKAIGGFKHQERKGCFRAYLRTAALHALGRRSAKSARQEAVLDPRTFDALTRTSAGEDTAWRREEYLDRIRRAIRSLAKEFRPATLEAFRLHVLANRSVAETAEQLGLSREYVYQVKSRVLKRLRERIASMDEEERR